MSKWILPFADKFITGHYGTLSDYRRRMKMQPHSGTDWARPAGTLIPALTSGTVKLIQFSKILGWVVVQSGRDNKGKIQYIGYCHLFCSEHGAKCHGPEQGCKTPLESTKIGDKVEVGQKYLRVGNSGSASTGAHLHLTIGDTIKSVFGPTTAKIDAYEFLKSQISAKPSQKPAAKKAPAKKADVCPTCKREM
jgi:murein DD-endopeptidase MepM/ murein hydrolase activator NlpD